MRVALALLLCALGAAPALGSPEIALAPDSPRPGEVMFLTFQPESELLRAACSWNGRSYPLLAGEHGWGVVLPVPMDAAAGPRRAMLYWKYTDGGMGQAELPVQVARRQFGVQHLRLSQQQESTYTDPAVARERRLIREALDLVTPEQRWRGSFQMPVEGRISTEYGLQRYINNRLAYRHRGVDIAAPQGTPVRAAADGRVALADDSFVLHGQTIILDHGQGVTSLYIHLSEILVEARREVAQGEVIGRVGATGVATGPHLHYAVYAYGECVDPHFWNQLPPG